MRRLCMTVIGVYAVTLFQLIRDIVEMTETFKANGLLLQLEDIHWIIIIRLVMALALIIGVEIVWDLVETSRAKSL